MRYGLAPVFLAPVQGRLVGGCCGGICRAKRMLLLH